MARRRNDESPMKSSTFLERSWPWEQSTAGEKLRVLKTGAVTHVCGARSCSRLSLCPLAHMHAVVFYPKAAFQHIFKSSPISLGGSGKSITSQLNSFGF